MQGEVTVPHGIEFGVKDIELPPPRDYYFIQNIEGEKSYVLQLFTMDEIREEFSNRTSYEMPPVQGNWDNVKVWVENMWEAMYNPLWFRWYDPPNKRGWSHGVFDGHHRMRLFDALDANVVWAYVQNVRHFPQPSWVRELKRLNARPPRKGTHEGDCPTCNRRVSYKVYNQPNHRLMGGILKCSRCGTVVDYPWPGVL
jgi:hypothetical protein